MTGTTLDALDYVPRPVLDYLSRQLGISAPELTTLRALYRRQMTLFMHQRWACEHAGFRRHNAAEVAEGATPTLWRGLLGDADGIDSPARPERTGGTALSDSARTRYRGSGTSSDSSD